MTSAVDLLSPVWTHLTTIQPTRAEGIYLYDANETRYTDFTSGIGVVNTGHCHPRVVQAIQEQASQLIFGQMNVVIPPAALRLVELLDEVTPASIDQFFLSNSGAEAVEASVKLARMATKRRNLIVFQGSFHGRTHQAMAMTTSKYVYRYNYQPLPGGIFVAPFPYSYYYGWSDAETVEFAMRQLDQLLHSQTAPDETAAIVIEPVLGEGGYVPAPPAFLRRLRELCDEHGILLIADEIQSGFGRTGRFFGFEHADIEPDILIMAKGLGSGMPISAIGARAELMAQWKPGTHGGTYGGGNAGRGRGRDRHGPGDSRGRPGRERRGNGRPAAGRAQGNPGRASPDRRRTRARAHGGDRVHGAGRHARRGHGRPGPQSMSRAQPAAPHLRHLRQRHPLDSTAGGQRRTD